MKVYSVFINGQNFLIESGGKLEKVGFYTTRFVEAENEKDAEDKAISMMCSDLELKKSAQNEKDNPPMMYTDKIGQVEKIPDHQPGLVFYNEE